MVRTELWRAARAAIARWRVGRGPTRWFGPTYQRSRERVEIDVTWACNLRCNNCNRSCQQAPTGEQMSLAQIEAFVEESIAAGCRWERIRLLGGEPTLHPQIDAIVRCLLQYRIEHSPDTVIELVTNGYGERVRAVLARMPLAITIDNSAKTSEEQMFDPFNVAPVDLPAYADADFTNGCGVTQHCGIGLTPYGWYPCAVAGGMDRVVGHDLGRRSLPASADTLVDQLDAFCRLCGSFPRDVAPVTQPVRSAAWEAAYREHRRQPPQLTLYGERRDVRA